MSKAKGKYQSFFSFLYLVSLEYTFKNSVLYISKILVWDQSVILISLPACKLSDLYKAETSYPAGLLQHQGESAL